MSTTFYNLLIYQNIMELDCYQNIMELDYSLRDIVFNEIASNLDVLRLIMKYWISGSFMQL